MNNNKRPVIGLIPLFDEEKDSYWMLPGYMKILEENGAVPLMLPLTENKEILDYCLESMDGFLFTGGQDIHPSIYGAEITNKCGTVCELRDVMETYLLSEIEKKDIPAFGICRGMQLMNAFWGGTLYQDIESEYTSVTEHHMKPPYDELVHEVTVLKETPLEDILGEGTLRVNSYHHQAVKEVADKLQPMALSEDGLVEAVFMPDKKFIVGIQWHPEFSYISDENSVKIVQGFIGACKKNMIQKR